MSALARQSIGEPHPADKVRTKRVLQGVLTLAALAWCAHSGAWRETAGTFAKLRPGWFALAMALYLAGQSLCAWKWKVLAEGQGYRRPGRFYWAVYLGAMFPALFLPTSIGGDLFRILALTQSDERRDRIGAAVTVLADRGTGVLAMACICVGVSLGEHAAGLPGPAVHAIQAVGSLLMALFALPFIGGRLRFRERCSPAILTYPWLTLLRESVNKVLRCWDDPPRLLLAAGAALVFQGMMGAVYWMLGLALALPAPPLFYFVLAPIASLAAALPFTINGLGERMAALIFLFGAVGVGAEQAIAFGLEWTALATLAALGGGGIYVLAGGAGFGAMTHRAAGRAAP